MSVILCIFCLLGDLRTVNKIFQLDCLLHAMRPPRLDSIWLERMGHWIRAEWQCGSRVCSCTAEGGRKQGVRRTEHSRSQEIIYIIFVLIFILMFFFYSVVAVIFVCQDLICILIKIKNA